MISVIAPGQISSTLRASLSSLRGMTVCILIYNYTTTIYAIERMVVSLLTSNHFALTHLLQIYYRDGVLHEG